jgi:hypothetical protein
MDLDALQAKLIETSNIAWSMLLAMNAGFSGMTLAAYLASLQNLPRDFRPGRCGSMLLVISLTSFRENSGGADVLENRE